MVCCMTTFFVTVVELDRERRGGGVSRHHAHDTCILGEAASKVQEIGLYPEPLTVFIPSCRSATVLRGGYWGGRSVGECCSENRGLVDEALTVLHLR